MHYHILPVTPFQQNATLLWCGHTRQAVIVDPGGEAERIIGQVQALDLTPTAILLTHGHLDHVGASTEIARRFAIPIWGPHAADAFWIDGLSEQCAMFGFPPVPPITPDRWLEAGERISVGLESLEVIHCPGHTPGHLAFLDVSGRLAQVGDVLFRGSIGRTDFPGGSHAQLLESIHGLFSLGDDIRFIPGHGPLSTFGEERRTNPFVRR
ncbi:MAG: MBL fold metallo-hydrolase [Sphingobacteriia bacterium]|nr:MBL fold metallo-hydrolase [Sphingobacteriia bacterium]NCC40091.1 MBL fold metallo-hydrolase [Gammaproteobacteria bacterium]